jgi:hypothetical protein
MNASKISKELSQKFSRSVAQHSRIKGFKRNSEGFSVKQITGEVLVFWHSGLFNDSNRLAEVHAYLVERGYEVVNQDWQLKVVA